MNYCVLVHISKSTISFWYQLEGAPFEPLSFNEGNSLPMYFYANGNDFILGSIARERFLNGDNVNAFGNYFEIITNPSIFFSVYGNKKHVKFLLYYAVEKYLSHFINSVLYKNESIEGYRNNFPLRFIFSQDIAPKERLLVESIFKESGYDNAISIPYHKHLFEHLIKSGIVSKYLPTILLTGIDGNLFIELFDKSFDHPVGHLILEDEGADPRIKIMAKMIYDNAMASTRMRLSEKSEIAHLISYALDFLSQDSALPKGDVKLSDGTTCWVKIRRKDLDDILLYYEGDVKIYKTIEKLVSINNLKLTSLQIILNSESINTFFFLDKLKKKFTFVEGVPANTENEVIKLLFRQISNTGYINQDLQIKTNESPSTTDLNRPTPLTHPTEEGSRTPPPLPRGSHLIAKPPLPLGRTVTSPRFPSERPVSHPPLPVGRPVTPPPMPGAGRPISPPPLPGGGRPIPPLPSIKEPSNASRSNKLDNQKKNNVSANSIPPPPPPPPLNSSTTDTGAKKNATTKLKQQTANDNQNITNSKKSSLKNESFKEKKNETKSTPQKAKDDSSKVDKKRQILNLGSKLYTSLLQVDSQTKSKLYISPNINQIKFQNLMNKLGLSIPYSECLIQYDDTLFGAGDNGILITENLFVWRNLLESGKYISWKDIKTFAIDGETKVILQDVNGFENIINTGMIRKSWIFASCFSDLLKFIKN